MFLGEKQKERQIKEREKLGDPNAQGTVPKNAGASESNSSNVVEVPSGVPLSHYSNSPSFWNLDSPLIDVTGLASITRPEIGFNNSDHVPASCYSDTWLNESVNQPWLPVSSLPFVPELPVIEWDSGPASSSLHSVSSTGGSFVGHVYGKHEVPQTLGYTSSEGGKARYREVCSIPKVVILLLHNIRT